MYHIYHLQVSTTGFVVLMPPQNYTVFENNAAAVFNCSGDGYAVFWYLNGAAYNAVHVQLGIRIVPATPTGGVVSSSLYIPARATNNNTEVICKVADGTLTNVQTSGPANLTIQGENTIVDCVDVWVLDNEVRTQSFWELILASLVIDITG